jgi:guanylate kinase
MIEQGAFAEWAEVHGNRYGTAVATLERYRSEGHDVLLDIDCQGARQLKTTFGQGVFIFILPPSLDELQRRLTGRNTDAPDVIARRIANARDEIREALWYDYLVVNDDLPQALTELKAIVIAEGCRTAPRQNIIVRILESA